MRKYLAVTLGRCSGCSIFVDDKIIFSASEERYSRKKSDQAYPLHAINDGLEFCGIKPEELDYVLIAGKRLAIIPILLQVYTNFSVNDHLDMMRKYWYHKLVRKEPIKMIDIFKDRINIEQYPFNTSFAKELDFFKLEHPISKESDKIISSFYKKAISTHLGVHESKIIHIEHDDCHAAYAFFGSPIRDDNTLIFTADAFGDDLSGTISKYNKDTNSIIRLKEYFHKDFQLARIYRYTTLLLRMSPNEHEYKVMGLAPYYNGPVINEVVKVFEEMQVLEGLNFRFNKDIDDIYEYLEKNLNRFRFDHIAAGLQTFTEKILIDWFSKAMSEYNSSSVVFSGGVSMNVKANMNLAQLPQIKKFFVCGAGTDETLPMGACYYQASSEIIPKSLESLYLGPNADYDEKELKLFSKHRISEFTNVEELVDKILNNRIIATCRGRMEMGQRALGNRSILADPRDSKNIQKINKMIKNRDFWMPFAPIVLYEYQEEVIVNTKRIESPYMTIAFEAKNKEKIQAAIHQADFTARPQILRRETNPMLWDLIKKFYDETGVPALLNTSFNLHGEPIVRTVDDAARVFDKSGLEVLWLDKHIIEKNISI
ncbi:carbamoyltransferase C-terminal domain-containing protein [Candidatus Nitrosotenuis cloacae]|uniref:carbamoyltransferase C-terminal domain-containing protein n=1 Tax=Candidatus Nitrosotenuis cloacae TaxID=1603555 RepID=UPI00227DF030|nr:carbamoyltransferase C-terminal domain-containing protein [Candidatus Nitrosotenuis cloacae]